MAEELIVRPSLRRAKLTLILAAVILATTLYTWWLFREHVAWWVIVVGAFPFLAPVLAWIDHRRTCLTLSGRILSYHQGFIATSTERIDVSKVQNVKVERTLVDRIWGVGTLVIETASESGRLVMQNVDAPAQVADRIVAAGARIEQQGRQEP
ncbi:MAG: hypothetical protein C0504_15455 [Candidatus Solibacter sp.]|nr:hypothetical protein [Candidatus Solibacter sp.]